MYLGKAKKLFESIGIASAHEVIPCTKQEMEDLEKQCGMKLPAAYKEFLLWMGHGAGLFLRDINCFYEDLSDKQ